jgi:hypothetical protein
MSAGQLDGVFDRLREHSDMMLALQAKITLLEETVITLGTLYVNPKFSPKITVDDIERVAEAMMDHAFINAARLHGVEGSIEYWREFALVALRNGGDDAPD